MCRVSGNGKKGGSRIYVQTNANRAFSAISSWNERSIADGRKDGQTRPQEKVLIWRQRKNESRKGEKKEKKVARSSSFANHAEKGIKT